MIYHSKEEGDLDTFLYSFRRAHSLLHSFFTQNFQRPGLLWLGVNETVLTPLGKPMPKFFSGSDLVFCAEGGVVTCMTHLLALFSAYHCSTCLNDLISWPLFFYDEKQF